jgi:hypothetical protein
MRGLDKGLRIFWLRRKHGVNFGASRNGTAESAAVRPPAHFVVATAERHGELFERRNDGSFSTLDRNTATKEAFLDDIELWLRGVEQTAAGGGAGLARFFKRSPVEVGDIDQVNIVAKITTAGDSFVGLQRVLAEVQIRPFHVHVGTARQQQADSLADPWRLELCIEDDTDLPRGLELGLTRVNGFAVSSHDVDKV